MSVNKYFITYQNGVYFLTFTGTDWIDSRLTGRQVFTGKEHKYDCASIKFTSQIRVKDWNE